MAAHVEPLFPNSKPVDGDVLILCEGDAVGYETALMKGWADGADLNGRFVKVLACGTASALFGVADAIGRTVPIIAVEDRDFRTTEEAASECSANLRNREARGVAMRAWRSWRRAEIENYFMDDSVLVPVLAEKLACGEDDVRNAVLQAVRELAVGQALARALYRARRSWLSTDANKALRVPASTWGQDAPEYYGAEAVRSKLEERLKKWQMRLHNGASWEDPLKGEQLLADFDSACKTWNGLEYTSEEWRRDWGCKEVLQRVRMLLCSSRPGWWSIEPGQPVQWGACGSQTRAEHDRRIERELQPYLVRKLLDKVVAERDLDLRRELDEMASVIRAA